MGNKVGLRVDSERNLYVEALVYEIKGKKVNISSKSKYFTFMYIFFIYIIIVCSQYYLYIIYR